MSFDEIYEKLYKERHGKPFMSGIASLVIAIICAGLGIYMKTVAFYLVAVFMLAIAAYFIYLAQSFSKKCPKSALVLEDKTLLKKSKSYSTTGSIFTLSFDGDFDYTMGPNEKKMFDDAVIGQVFQVVKLKEGNELLQIVPGAKPKIEYVRPGVLNYVAPTTVLSEEVASAVAADPYAILSTMDEKADVVIACDLFHKITYVNQAACEKLGATKESLLGQMVLSYISSEEMIELQKLLVSFSEDASLCEKRIGEKKVYAIREEKNLLGYYME